MRRALRLREVKQKTNLSAATIYRGGAAGWFPKHFALSPNRSAWDEDEIDAYLERCRQARPAPMPLIPRRPRGRPRKHLTLPTAAA
jgi:prophage regulatory protein